MSKFSGELVDVQPAPANVCFVNPALLPDWFWLPTAHLVEQAGLTYSVPSLPRSDTTATLQQGVDAIEEAMQPHDLRYVVALSRGIECTVRYLDRLAKQEELGKILGWMVISSVGPRGSESSAQMTGQDVSRHTPGYSAGISMTSTGLETIDQEAAEKFLLHDVADPNLRAQALADLVPVRPLTSQEVVALPQPSSQLPKPAWYIGRNDLVDNTELSATVARNHFGVEPTYTQWGHVGPLSHTEEVARAIIQEIEKAQEKQR